MEAIVIHPRTKQQLEAIKAFAKALKMDFETTPHQSPYNPEFVKKILQGRKDVKEGRGVKVAIEDFHNPSYFLI